MVNGVYWGLGFEVPAKANVDYADPYKPLFYGFNGYRRGSKASDHALGKVLPEGQPAPPAEPKKKDGGKAHQIGPRGRALESLQNQ